MVGWLAGCLVGWFADWLASWLSSRMASLLAQIAWLRFDGFACWPADVIRTCLAAAFDSSISHDNWLGSLVNELNSFVRLGSDRNTLLSLFTCSLPFFVWLYLLSVSAWFATALLSLGTRLGSPPRHFYGAAQRAPHKNYGGRAFICVLCFASLNCVLCCQRTGPHKYSGRKLLTCVLCFALLFAYIACLDAWLVGWLPSFSNSLTSLWSLVSSPLTRFALG